MAQYKNQNKDIRTCSPNMCVFLPKNGWINIHIVL